MDTSYNFSGVEKSFFKKQEQQRISTKIPYLVVDSFPQLGLMTALRFLEWVQENPKGVISLPTGKTPEHFIKWTKYIIENWKDSKVEKIRIDNGLSNQSKPDLSALQFVQIDEFYPIASTQHNSFYNYVNKFYIDGFGLDPDNALLINSDEIPLFKGMHFKEVFPDSKVDLSLRYREAKSKTEEIQKESIYLLDEWCSSYEKKIREKGGIGFFLGGIGPDGHIAFNIKGSDIYSTTRLMETNFETQAVAAGDLGGIEVSKNRLVITIGLETITFNKNATALIFAAGEAKADVVKNSLEAEMQNIYPGTVLQKLPNACFYLTKGAATQLEDYRDLYFREGDWTQEKSEKAIMDLCVKIDKFGHNLTLEDLKADCFCSMIPGLNEGTVDSVRESIIEKINTGLSTRSNCTFYHTGPHHDDIQLGILPKLVHDFRKASNDFTFTVMTSGFTAVTNSFVLDSLKNTLTFLRQGRIEMLEYPDFFENGFKYKFDKDVSHFLNKVAAAEPEGRSRGLSHRITRSIVEIYAIKSKKQLEETILSIIHEIENSYDGQKNSKEIQTLKGMIREFEEELVWAHYGFQVKNIHHLRLGFYTGDIFTPQPERSRDVLPILEQLREIDPDVISLALDPEGSGPDTHYKVLQAIAEAIRLWSKEKDLSGLRVIGYRNVWYRFHPAEADVIVPVSLNTMAELDDAFSTCYLSQVDAPFPSYMHDGKFSTLAQKIWVDQYKQLQFLLGKEYFYANPNPRLRAAHGFLLYKEMDVNSFLSHARELEKSMEG